MPSPTDPPEDDGLERPSDPLDEYGAQVSEAVGASRRAAPLGIAAMSAGRTPLADWTGFDMGSLKARVGRIQGNYVDKNEATLRAIQTTATAIAILLGVALALLEISRLI